MSQKFLTPVDLTGNELLNFLVQNLASAPTALGLGQFYYDTVTNKAYYWNGTIWFDLTNALTLNGNAESLYARLAGPTFTGVPSAPTAAPGTNTTQLATTAFAVAEILARIASLDAMIYKGAIDCSANPNYPAADAGWQYRISVAGKIGGASGPNVEAGDMIICHVDSSASGNQATVGANWDIIQLNIDGAVTLTGSQTLTNKTLTSPIINVGSDATGDIYYRTAGGLFARLAIGSTNDVLKVTGGLPVWAAPASSALRYAVDVGDGSSVAIVITHGLGTRDVMCDVHRATTPWDRIHCDVEYTSTTTITLRFTVAPTAAQYRAVVVG